MKGSKLLLGVSGSIAAYKAAELTRQLKKAGADVQVIMTSDAARFIPPLTLSTLSGRDTLIDIFPDQPREESWTKHIELGLWADLFVIAPATAQTMAKLAHGFCDNMLTAVALAARCPLLICPAMDRDMYLHPATRANLDRLESFGHRIIPPETGELASGLIGTGRLPDPADIVTRIASELGLSNQKKLQNKRVLVTAGPTRESIDPVRFISNHSTGAMGYAIAGAAQHLGADVILVSGPTGLPTPVGVTRIDVSSAAEMADAVFAHRDADIVFMAAAVADYTPAEYSSSKVKKSESSLSIPLKRTTDILEELGKKKHSGQLLVGFALETDHALENALSKLSKKNLDWIVLNNPKEEGAGFGLSTNKVTLIQRNGNQEALPLMPKQELAEFLLDRVLQAELG